jgi:hypothetical protein
MFYRHDKIGTGRLEIGTVPNPDGPIVDLYFRHIFPHRTVLLDEIFPDIAKKQMEELGAQPDLIHEYLRRIAALAARREPRSP